MTDGINQGEAPRAVAPLRRCDAATRYRSRYRLVRNNLLHIHFHFLSKTFIPSQDELNSETCIKPTWKHVDQVSPEALNER